MLSKSGVFVLEFELLLAALLVLRRFELLLDVVGLFLALSVIRFEVFLLLSKLIDCITRPMLKSNDFPSFDLKKKLIEIDRF